MRLPYAFHDLRVAIPNGRLHMVHELKGIVFDKLSAAGTSLCVSRIRYTKPPLDFAKRDRAHPDNVVRRIVVEVSYEGRVLLFPRRYVISVQQVTWQKGPLLNTCFLHKVSNRTACKVTT